MSIAIWNRGRRLFTTAALLMILTAAAHTAGNLSRGPGSPEEQRVFTAMSELHFPGMGMNPSLQDVYWDLILTMSVTFAALGLINLLLAASPEIPDSVLRRVGWANAFWVGGYLILNWVYRIPPPFISAVVIEVFVVASLLIGGPPKARPTGPR